MYVVMLSALALLIGIGTRIMRGSAEEGLPEHVPPPSEGEMEEVSIS